uniref:Uncharacterized protein n=1 Tax=Arundo donax TaxID=35708 RepID=A0A0A9ESA5_ARUDO
MLCLTYGKVMIPQFFYPI